MIHKVFALSNDKVENQRSFLSLFDELPRRRLELRFGKFSMPDFFDINSVGSDTHFQFLNWTIDNNGAWDYAADTRGYTVGLTADYEDRNWGFRFAEVAHAQSRQRHRSRLETLAGPRRKLRIRTPSRIHPEESGVVRLLAYTNSANMGIYRDQVIEAAEAGTTPDITNHPWDITRKYGFGINLEQNLTQYLTAYARFGWDNGKTESFAYTEVDQTFDRGPRRQRRVVASQAGPRRHRLRQQRHQEGSPELSRGRRSGIPPRRRPPHLRPREYFRDLLHRTRLARNLSRTRRAAHR